MITEAEVMVLKANNVESQKYPELVSSLIRERYTLDAEFAIINNHAYDPASHSTEWNEYQSFRAECKARAKSILGLN